LREPDVAIPFLEPLGGPTEGSNELEVSAAEKLPPSLARGVAEGRQRLFRVAGPTLRILRQDGVSTEGRSTCLLSSRSSLFSISDTRAATRLYLSLSGQILPTG